MNLGEWLSRINGAVNDFVWGPWMLLLIVGTGVYLTARVGFLQFRRFGYAMKLTVGRIFSHGTAAEGAVPPYQAVATALAATVGTGNIAGVAGAIALGGPGAVFWMWLSALFGMVTKYAEVVLAIRYRQRNDKGEWIGGPMYYIQNGLGKRWKWLATLFAAFGALAAFGIGNMTQINTISSSVFSAITAYAPDAKAYKAVICAFVGVIVALLVLLVLVGGIRRIGAVTGALVPVMSLFYIVGATIVIISNIENIGAVFSSIFTGAFQPQAITGGAAGITIMTVIQKGVGRGVFSNEAGLGSAPIAHAAADTESPVHQGLFGIFEVFADTIVICTLTALSILASGVIASPEAAASSGALYTYGQNLGVELTVGAFSTVFDSGVTGILVAVAISLFAASTIFGWSLYGVRCAEYLAGNRKLFGVSYITLYKLLFVAFVVVGACMRLDLAWNIADTLNGLMAIPNLIALLALSGVVIALTKAHFAGREP